MAQDRSHWDSVYRRKTPESVSWFQDDPRPSLDALSACGPGHRALIDVGGGASGLVDALLARGWQDLSVLDISQPALAHVQARLGHQARKVHWIVADLTDWRPDRSYDIWHDRAVFHFLTAPEQRSAYIAALRQALRPGGLAILATFAPDGPDKCSGLPVRKYGAPDLWAELGDEFHLRHAFREVHHTPSDVPQPFTWAVFQRDDRRAPHQAPPVHPVRG